MQTEVLCPVQAPERLGILTPGGQRPHSEPNPAVQGRLEPRAAQHPRQGPQSHTEAAGTAPGFPLCSRERAPRGAPEMCPQRPSLPAWEISTSVSAGQKGRGPQLHGPKTQSAETLRRGLGVPLVPHYSPRNVTRCQGHRGRERTDPAWPPSLPSLVGEMTTDI